jgi:hypothetical protein
MQITISRAVATGVFIAIVAGASMIGYVTGASAQVPAASSRLILTGDNLAFQPVGSVKADPKGSLSSVRGVLMVRMNGKWVRAEVQDDVFGAGVRPLGQ